MRVILTVWLKVRQQYNYLNLELLLLTLLLLGLLAEYWID
nr:MAG TPA: hypothetical protein [Caudoviricetes sp.]